MESFLTDCEIKRHSVRTVESRRERLSRLIWMAERENWQSIGTTEVRAFFGYLSRDHEQGRWDNPKMVKPLSSGRVKSYFSTYRTFFKLVRHRGGDNRLSYAEDDHASR